MNELVPNRRANSFPTEGRTGAEQKGKAVASKRSERRRVSEGIGWRGERGRRPLSNDKEDKGLLTEKEEQRRRAPDRERKNREGALFKE